MREVVKLEADSDSTRSWCSWNSPKNHGKATEKTENERKDRGHPALLKSPGILRKDLEN